MAASACSRSGGWSLAVALTLCVTARAHAESTSQAELTCVLSTGELLRSGQDDLREEPPWQSLTSLRRGDENRARVALSSTEIGFLPGVTTSAILRLELGLNQPPTETKGVRDAASSLAVAWQATRTAQLSLRAFPFDTNYLRLGYLHALDWGGTDAEHGESIFLAQTGAVPGLQLGLQATRAQVFLGLKWARADDALQGDRRLWGVLSGGRVDLSRSLRVEGGFGYFQRPARTPGAAAASFVEGASLRVVWHHLAPEPELSAEPFRPPSLAEDATRLDAEEQPGFALALEGVTLVQRLRRFEQPDTTSLKPAPAAALYGSARGRILAVHAAFSWRSLAFVQRNDARLASGDTLPRSARARDELTAWLGGSVILPSLHLVPSFELAVRLPAALETPSALPGFGQTLVAGGPAGLDALPIGAGRLPVVSGRAGARFRVSARVALALFGEYRRDPNRVVFAASSSGVTRAFAHPDSLAFFATGQARF